MFNTDILFFTGKITDFLTTKKKNYNPKVAITSLVYPGNSEKSYIISSGIEVKDLLHNG